MVGRSLPQEPSPGSRIPVTFQEDRPSVFCIRRMLPVFEDPVQLDEQIGIIKEAVVAPMEHTSVHIWNVQKTWFWCAASDKQRTAGFQSNTTKYRSFLGSMWSASKYFTGKVSIRTQSQAHVKRFCSAMARIRLKDPRYAMTENWQAERAIFQRLHDGWSIQRLDEDWESPWEIEPSGLLEDHRLFHPVISITYQGKDISNIHQMRDITMSQEYIRWIKEKCQWSESVFHEIAWQEFHKAIQKFEGHQNSIRKFIHGWLPVVEMVRRYNPHKITTCPCCHGRERQDHVLRCPAPCATDKTTTLFNDFWSSLEKNTDPELLQCMQRHMRR